MPTLTLKPGREKSLLRRHPWIFSGAVASVEGDPASGASVEVLAADGQFLARAAYSPSSQIRARVWTLDPAEAVEAEFFRKRLRAAIAMRVAGHTAEGTDAYRLVHAESDGLPGLIVTGTRTCWWSSSFRQGPKFWREAILDSLLEETGLETIYETLGCRCARTGGAAARTGLLARQPAQSRFTIQEHGLVFNVDIAQGHKTGFYLDQRENRLRVRGLAAERDVLDCFLLFGRFQRQRAAGGARSVLSVDASAEALAICQANVALLTSHDPSLTSRHAALEGDVFQVLRKARDERRSFDLVILDPPKFAPTAALAEKAARGYKDINRLAFKLLRPGGLLVTFSCSGGVDANLFQRSSLPLRWTPAWMPRSLRISSRRPTTRWPCTSRGDISKRFDLQERLRAQMLKGPARMNDLPQFGSILPGLTTFIDALAEDLGTGRIDAWQSLKDP